MSQTGVDLRGAQVGGNITINGVNVGLTAPEMQELIRAAVVDAVGLDSKTKDLSQKLEISHGAMRTMLVTVGHADIPDEKLLEKLSEVFEHYRKAAATIDALQPDNPVAQAHVAEAAEAVSAGDSDGARRHLRAARAAAEGAVAEARRLAREADLAVARQLQQAMRAVVAEAELVLTALDYREAAQLFGEAAAMVPNEEQNEKGELLTRQADALLRHGEDRSDNAALRRAVALYGRVLELWPVERVPLQWAMAQNNLGTALARLGERESGTARLEQAVEAYQAALEECTRERVSLVWARMQNNLGNALSRLGQRESGTARLEQAVEAYQAALEECTRERVPLDWARIHHNLGRVL
jgi:exonuclease VII small subunit